MNPHKNLLKKLVKNRLDHLDWLISVAHTKSLAANIERYKADQKDAKAAMKWLNSL